MDSKSDLLLSLQVKCYRIMNQVTELWFSADGKVKNVHYILSPKPWDTRDGDGDPTWQWWWDENDERIESEKKKGLQDEFTK